VGLPVLSVDRLVPGPVDRDRDGAAEVIDDRTMVDLRLAATLVHALPGITLRVAGARARFRVGHGVDGNPEALTPCGFRVAVTHAHHLRRDGRPVGLVGLCPAEVPELTLEADDGHAVRPGGVCVLEDGAGEGYRVAAATTLPRDVCRDELAGPVEGPEDAVPLGLHHDEATEVTLIHAHAVDDEELDLAVRAVESALARCTAAELLAELAAA